MLYSLNIKKLRDSIPDGVSIYGTRGNETIQINAMLMDTDTQILYLLKNGLWDKTENKTIWTTIFEDTYIMELLEKEKKFYISACKDKFFIDMLENNVMVFMDKYCDQMSD